MNNLTLLLVYGECVAQLVKQNWSEPNTLLEGEEYLETCVNSAEVLAWIGPFKDKYRKKCSVFFPDLCNIEHFFKWYEEGR